MPRWLHRILEQYWLIALVAGLLGPFALAPYNLWPLGLASVALLSWILDKASTKQSFNRSFFYGLGLFGKGASWVYVAVHDFGFTAAPLAFTLTAIFVAGLALVFALPFLVLGKFFHHGPLKRTLVFSSIFVLGEWSRSWFLTGFPWLYVGYGHIDTWLSGWAPIFGVFGLSFFAVISAVLVTEICVYWKSINANRRLVYGTIVLIIWGAGKGASYVSWQEDGQAKTISLAIVQPNIPLEIKWNPIYREEIMAILREESAKHWDKDLIIWPEAAIPVLYHDAHTYLEEMQNNAIANSSGLITGILYDDEQPGIYYNSIVGLGRAQGLYFKQRLVPFGEYVPLEEYLRGLIAFFDLPNSIIFPGPRNQEILKFDDFKVAPSICYEIVYPDLVSKLAKEADFLITISNDAWFGKSIGPMQHFQMAQMRALENRMNVLRSTNTGVSGIINPYGETTHIASQFEQVSLSENALPLKKANTPFSIWGSSPIVICCFLILAIIAATHLKRRQSLIVGLPG